ncbi:MAG: hypothetical protein LQ347_001174 [Umbilicaria vellea]|nr:MAG: hypothetical protein LQ347_001174 [Umbilicaria vellea]
MSSSALHDVQNDPDNIIRPRAVKPGNPMVLRAMSEEGAIKADPTSELLPSDGSRSALDVPHLVEHTNITSSGRSTPLPPDAPPSVQSISSARRHVRAQVKRRLFPTIEYTARVSHFDPKSEYTNFRGFFVLFWIGLAIMVITTMLRNIKDTGYPLRVQVWALLTENTWQLALSDLAMVLSTGLSLPLQHLFNRSNGSLGWKRAGMPIQSAFQLAWLGLWVKWVASKKADALLSSD